MEQIRIGIVGYGNLGLEPAKLLYHKAKQLISGMTAGFKYTISIFFISKNLDQLREIGNCQIRVMTKYRIDLQSGSPKAVEHLMDTVDFCVMVIDQIYNLYVHFPLDGIIGNDTGKENLIVVTVGGQQKQVG